MIVSYPIYISVKTALHFILLIQTPLHISEKSFDFINKSIEIKIKLRYFYKIDIL